MKFSELPDLTNNNKHILLKCWLCYSECSAHKGDYFFVTSDREIKCCDEPMQLVEKTNNFIPLSD